MRGRACAPLALLLAATPAAAATLTTRPFGATADGKPVTLTTMTSAHGVTVKFTSYGGIITEVIAPTAAATRRTSWATPCRSRGRAVLASPLRAH